MVSGGRAAGSPECRVRVASTALVDRRIQRACFIVRDANRQALAYGYFEEETGRRMGDAPAHARAETNIDAAMLSFQAVFVRLIEHLVGAHHQRHRDVDTECLCGCEINHQLELGRQGDRKVGGVGAF